MTVNSFLKSIDITDQTTAARYPDGSGGRDGYILTVAMDGHGKLLNAKVRSVHIGHGLLYLQVTGESVSK